MYKKLLKKIRPYLERIDALSMRERILIGLGLCAVIGFLGYYFLVIPADQKIAKLQIQKNTLTQGNLTLKNEIEMLKLKVNKEKTKGVRRGFLEKEDQIMTSKEMISLLKSLLVDSNNLHLLSLKNLPDKLLLASSKDSVSLYQQSIVLAFTGEYFNTLSYLKKLETQKKQIFWSSLDYSVIKYPTANVTIRLYTLSREKEE